MCCDMPIEEGVRNAADCVCFAAVMRTFTGLSDEPYSVAEEAAIRVYRFHHPEDTKHAATLTVQRWLADASAHAVH